MATLIIAIAPRLDKDEAGFTQSWLESLEPCQNIVSVVEQWDNQHSPRIDPAIVSSPEAIQFQCGSSRQKIYAHATFHSKYGIESSDHERLSGCSR